MVLDRPPHHNLFCALPLYSNLKDASLFPNEKSVTWGLVVHWVEVAVLHVSFLSLSPTYCLHGLSTHLLHGRLLLSIAQRFMEVWAVTWHIPALGKLTPSPCFLGTDTLLGEAKIKIIKNPSGIKALLVRAHHTEWVGNGKDGGGGVGA